MQVIRFQYDEKRGVRKKISSPLYCPLRLDLSPFVDATELINANEKVAGTEEKKVKAEGHSKSKKSPQGVAAKKVQKGKGKRGSKARDDESEDTVEYAVRYFMFLIATDTFR